MRELLLLLAFSWGLATPIEGDGPDAPHPHGDWHCRWQHDASPGTPVVVRWHVAEGFGVESHIDRPAARRLIRIAWQEWGERAGVTGVEVDSAAKAQVEFVSEVIDGPGDTAARAFFPCMVRKEGRGTVRFDSGEEWDATKFRRVARHEIGHAIGISHGPEASWMCPCWPDTEDAPDWTDIAEAQARYGPPAKNGESG